MPPRQLGAGFGTGWPASVDTRQTFRNSPLAAPDSDTRLDSEVINDLLAYVIAAQHTLGTNPQGLFGSLAARLNRFIPGGGAAVTVQAFPPLKEWVLPGTLHHLGSPALLVYVYDNADPAMALDPGFVTLDPASYDLTVAFGQAQGGLLVVSLGTPSYSTTFTDVDSIDIPGTTHQLATANFCWQVWDATGHIVEPSSISVHPTSFDVALDFGQEQSGRLVLAVPTGVSSTTFTDVTTVTITGATHGLDTRALCWQVWDAATPNTNSFAPETVTVDPVTFDITFDFGQPQSGRIVLGAPVGGTGVDFTLLDTGIPGQNAVRVYSSGGKLFLQHGAGDGTVLQNKTGGTLATVNATGQLGLGVTPTHQLHLSTDDAAKLATATWATTSDARLKEVLRPYTDGLELLLALDPVWYRYNGLGGIHRDEKEYVGLLAQAVQAVAPYMVTTRRGQLREGEEETDILELHSHSILFAAINAIKTLAQHVETLTALVLHLQTAIASHEEPTP